jgi:two-component system response regulator
VNDKVILLVEDNPDDVDLTRRAFQRANVLNELVVANDGVAAFDYLFEPGPDGALRPLPQLILLDLKLPRIDGLQVLERIRHEERTRILPVVILTSSREERDLVAGYKNGANSYVRKPVDFTEFMSAVQQLGVYWLVLNEAAPLEVR